MEYTGKFITLESNVFGKVDILEYKSTNNRRYCKCDMCKKPIIRTMYVVQESDTCLEIMYLGSECVKNVK